MKKKYRILSVLLAIILLLQLSVSATYSSNLEAGKNLLSDSISETLGNSSEEDHDDFTDIAMYAQPAYGSHAIYALEDFSLTVETREPGTVRLTLPEEIQFPEGQANNKYLVTQEFLSYDAATHTLDLYFPAQTLAEEEWTTLGESREAVLSYTQERLGGSGEEYYAQADDFFETYDVKLTPMMVGDFTIVANLLSGGTKSIQIEVMPPIGTLSATSPGFVTFDGKDLDSTSSLTYDMNTLSNNPINIEIVEEFDDSSGNNFTITIDIGAGLEPYFIPGYNKKDNSWVKDDTTLGDLEPFVETVTFTQSNEKYFDAYQRAGGQLVYKFTSGARKITLPLTIIGETKALGGADAFDLIEPFTVTSSTSKGMRNEAKIDTITITTPAAVELPRSNAALDNPVAKNGKPQRGARLATYYTNSANRNPVYIGNYMTKYEVPEEIDIVDVTMMHNGAPIVDTTLSVENTVEDGKKYATIRKTRHTSSILYYSIIVKANESAVVGETYTLKGVDSGIEYALHPTPGKLRTVSDLTVRVVSADAFQLVGMDKTQEFNLPRDGNMIALGGFYAKNEGLKPIENARVRMDFTDPSLQVRAFRVPSSTGQHDITIKTSDGHIIQESFTRAGGSSNFEITDFLPGIGQDARIETVEFILPLVEGGQAFGGNTAGNVLYRDISFTGYLELVDGATQAKATIQFTDFEDKEFSGINATAPFTTTLIPSAGRSRMVLTYSQSGEGAYSPKATIPISSTWRPLPYDTANNDTYRSVTGWSYYIREFPQTTLDPESIVITDTATGKEIVREDREERYIVKNGETYYEIKMPEAQITMDFPNQHGLKINYDIIVDPSATGYSEDYRNYIFLGPIDEHDIHLTGYAVAGSTNENTNDIDGSGVLDKVFLSMGRPQIINLIAKTDFSVSAASRLDDNAWGTYDPKEDTGQIVLNPLNAQGQPSQAEFKLQIENYSGYAINTFFAWIPIPKTGETTGKQPANPNDYANDYLAQQYMQRENFQWPVSISEEIDTAGKSLDYEILYSESYDSSDRSAGGQWKTWDQVKNNPENIRTVRVSVKSPIPNDTSEYVSFPISLPDNADNFAGNVNTYSAMIYREFDGATGSFVSDPVSITLRTGIVSGMVYADDNNNGTLDLGESGISNVHVSAYKVGESDPSKALVETTQTDKNGNYSFIGLLKEEDVYLVFENPSTTDGMRFSSPTPELDGLTAKTGAITPSSENSKNVNAGLMSPYTITFDKGTGNIAPGEETRKRYQGETVGAPPTWSQLGYTFAGWYTEKTGGTKIEIADFDTLSVTENTTFYARSNKNIYTITFDKNDGSTTPFHTESVGYAEVIPVPSPEPDRGPSYKFLGWASTKTATTPDFTGSTRATEDKTYYAVWETKVAVKYYANDGSTTPWKTEYYSAGETATRPTESPTPTDTELLNHYLFGGWSTEAGKDKTDDFDDNNQNVTTDISFYAVWSAREYKVSFNSHDASPPTSVIDVMVTYNNVIDTNQIPADPTREYYVFKGWTLDPPAEPPVEFDFENAKIVESITLKAVWEKKIKVEYYVNDGTTNVFHTEYIVRGKDATAPTGTPITANTVLNNHYEFGGWSTESGRDKTADFDQNKQNITEDTVFYAVWNAKDYKVTFDSNDGTPPTTTAEVSVTYNNYVPNDAIPSVSRDNYVFQGWSEDVTVSNPVLFDFSTTKIDKDISLKAVWHQQFRVDFYANDGSDQPFHTEYVLKGASATRQAEPTTSDSEIINHYTFGGWSTQQGKDKTDDFDIQSVNVTENKKFYAVWNANSYKVTFDSNDGTPPTVNTEVDVVYNNLLSTSQVPTGLQREHYIFRGWSENPDVSDPVLFKVEQTPITRPLALKAVWEKMAQVTFYLNDGNTPETKVAVLDVEIGTEVLPPTSPNNIPHYTFGGWSTSPGFEQENNFDTHKIITGDTQFYAVWNPVDYTVTFDSNGGDSYSEARSVAYGKSMEDLSLTLPTTPNYQGYVFQGWSTSSGMNNTIDFNEGSIIQGDMTVYAVWDKDIYTVSFSKNGGDTDPDPLFQEVKFQESIGLAGMPTPPERHGFAFKGWSSDSQAEETVPNFFHDTIVTESMTVHAVWHRSTFKADFMLNDGTNAVHSTSNVLYEANAVVPTVEPTRTGYTFAGWATEKDATYPNFDTHSKILKDTEYYAVWNINTYTITVEHWTYDAGTDKTTAAHQTTMDYTMPAVFESTITAREIREIPFYVYKGSDYPDATISKVTGDMTLKLYYEADNYTLKLAHSQVAVDVIDRYPAGTSITWQEFLDLVQPQTYNDTLVEKTSRTMSRNRVSNQFTSISSPDFANLRTDVITPGSYQTVTIEVEWGNGQVDSAQVQVEVVDNKAPDINLPFKRFSFYFGEIDEVYELPLPATEEEFIEYLYKTGMTLTDNYDGPVEPILSYLSGSYGSIKRNKKGEHIVYINAEDASGNKSPQQSAAIIVLEVWEEDTGGSSTPDESPNTPGGPGGSSPDGTQPNQSENLEDIQVLEFHDESDKRELDNKAPNSLLPQTGGVTGFLLSPLASLFLVALLIYFLVRLLQEIKKDKRKY